MLSMPKLIAAAIQFATAKLRFLKRDSGIRGSDWNRSQMMKMTRSAAPPAMSSGMVIA